MGTSPDAGPRPGRRPGRPRSLSRDDVARAALHVGLTNLSMPVVARRLGVGHSTLYRYVHDRDDLVLAALDLAVRDHEWPPAELAWRDLLTAFTDALWQFLRRHPGLAEAIQTAPGPPPRVADLMTAYVTRLRAEGLTGRDATIALDFIADLTVSTEITMRGLDISYDTTRGRRSLRDIYRDSWAAMPGSDPSLVDEQTYHGRGWLDDKLTIFLDGLATRLNPPDRSPQR